MTAGPAIRSRPVCHGVVARARRQRRVRSSAPVPAITAAVPSRTRTTTSSPRPGIRIPVLPASATIPTPSKTPRTTAMTPPPSQRSAPTWWASRDIRVWGSSPAGGTPPCWQGHSLRPRRSVDRMVTEPPATLAAWLRTRCYEQLGALLAARPDVARPAPSDVVALASRLAVPVSVDRALDELDAATLQVLDVVLLAPTDGVVVDELPAALPDLPDDVAAAAIDRLTARALLWGDELLRAPDPVRRAVRHPAGLGRRAVELRVQLPADLPTTLAELDAEERAVLERLAGERPVGHLPDTPGNGGSTPARRLLQRGLLARIDALNVELPREIGLAVRGDLPYGPPRLRPEPAVTTSDPTTADRRAAGAALESVGRIGELLTLLEEEPAGLLRSGGVGVRDQKRLARALHLGEADAGWLLELAYSAGLLDVGGPHRDEWLPTRAYDIWREQDLPDRWATLAAGWLSGVRLPSLVGQRDVAGKAVNPLSPDLVRHTAPAIRRSALTVLAEYPPGSGLAPDDLVALLRWRTPRRADQLAPVPAMLAEAARLGIVVNGVLSTAGRGLLAAGQDA